MSVTVTKEEYRILKHLAHGTGIPVLSKWQSRSYPTKQLIERGLLEAWGKTFDTCVWYVPVKGRQAIVEYEAQQ